MTRFALSVLWSCLFLLADAHKNYKGYRVIRILSSNSEQDRMWRKTHSIHVCPGRPDPKRGVDANRNFDFHWMEKGASSSPCFQTYAGPSAFSEPETAALRDYVLANAARTKLYISFHSYGNFLSDHHEIYEAFNDLTTIAKNSHSRDDGLIKTLEIALILYPWGYSADLPKDWKVLDDLAQAANSAQVAAGGSSCKIGSTFNVLYAAAGTSHDWVKGIGGIDLSYTVELPGGGDSGYDLPASHFAPTFATFFPAVRVMGQYVSKERL